MPRVTPTPVSCVFSRVLMTSNGVVNADAKAPAINEIYLANWRIVLKWKTNLHHQLQHVPMDYISDPCSTKSTNIY